MALPLPPVPATRLQQTLTERALWRMESVVRPPPHTLVHTRKGTHACTHINTRRRAWRDRADGGGWLVAQSRRHWSFSKSNLPIHGQVMKNEKGQNSTRTCLDTRARERAHTRASRFCTLQSVTYHDTESRVCLCAREKF